MILVHISRIVGISAWCSGIYYHNLLAKTCTPVVGWQWHVEVDLDRRSGCHGLIQSHSVYGASCLKMKMVSVIWSDVTDLLYVCLS